MGKHLGFTSILFIAMLSLFGQQQATSENLLKPQINGAKVFGVRPSHPLFFMVPVTGDKPLQFSASGLPKGIKIDVSTGIISGVTSKKGEYNVIIAVSNKHGKAEREIKIIIGDEICLAPPMGFIINSSEVAPTQQKLIKTMEAMDRLQLGSHGYTYLLIGDKWQGKRGGKLHAIMPDSLQFPEIKKAIAQVHKKGFKVGLYSSPWVTSSSTRIGSSADNPNGSVQRHSDYREDFRIGKINFFNEDAKQWAEWGVDFLDFEWNPADVRQTKLMYESIAKCGRDIVLRICGEATYDHASEWQRYANIWQTSSSHITNYDTLCSIAFSQGQWSPYTSPGHWPMPGIINSKITGTGALSSHSQEILLTQFTMWNLLSAPIILNCDPDQMDDMTKNIITNDEVIEIGQDPLSAQARCVSKSDTAEVYAKLLSDGNFAVGLFNKTDAPVNMAVLWKDLGITGGSIKVRNLWEYKDTGKFKEKFQVNVPARGTILIKVFKN